MMNRFSLQAFRCAVLVSIVLWPAYSEVVDVVINTSSLEGQAGGIYFQFAPGLNAAPADVAITDFQLSPIPPGALDPASPLNFSDGGASGSLDANNLVISNIDALNDYGEALTFGSKLSFVVTMNIPVQTTGNSGSELDVQVTGKDLLTPLLTSDPNGNIFVMSYDYQGAVSALSTSPEATVSAVPEPRYTWALLVFLTSLLGASALRSRCPSARRQSVVASRDARLKAAY